MATQEPRYPIFSEIGRAGSARFILRSEGGRAAVYNPDRITLLDYDEMRFDPQVRAGLAAIKFPIMRADWHIVSEDPDIAAFCNEALRRVWHPFIRNLLSGLEFGFSALEKLYEMNYDLEVTTTQGGGMDPVTKRYPRAVLIRRMLHFDPTQLFLLAVPQTSEFAGIEMLIGEHERIPKNKCVLWTNEEEFGELYGRPRTKPCYPFWFYKRFCLEQANLHVETYESGMKVGYYPPGQMESGKDAEGEPVYTDNQTYMLDQVEAMRSMSAIVLPSVYDDNGTGNRKWDVKILEAGKDLGGYTNLVELYDLQILRGLFVPDLTTQIGTVGSYAAASAHQDIFLLSEEGLLDDIAGVINTHILPDLVQFNFGRKAPAAYWEHAGLNQAIRESLSELFMQTLGQNRPIPVGAASEGGEPMSIGPDWGAIAEMTGIPVKWYTEADVEEAFGPDPAKQMQFGAEGQVPPGQEGHLPPWMQDQAEEQAAKKGGNGKKPPPGKEAKAELAEDEGGWRIVDGRPVFVEPERIELAEWDESEHPREPKGKKGKRHGGEFAAKKDEVAPAAGTAKQLWEMTREDVVWQEYLPDGSSTDRALKGRLARWEKIQKDAALQNEVIDVVDEAIVKEKARIARAASHRAAVETALSEGKPVPPEVLADYPELAAKYAESRK